VSDVLQFLRLLAVQVLQYETETVQQLLDMVADQDTQSREHASDTVSHRFFFNVYQMEVRVFACSRVLDPLHSPIAIQSLTRLLTIRFFFAFALPSIITRTIH
jgi:hypothetical protein